jgi:hypothetical protein
MIALIWHSRAFRAGIGLAVAIGLGATRTEKLMAEEFGGWGHSGVHCMLPQKSRQPFDPRRVPLSGGMAARLLSESKARLGGARSPGGRPGVRNPLAFRGEISI